MSDTGSHVQGEVNAGIASVSRMMEHIDTRENDRAARAHIENNSVIGSVTDKSNQNSAEIHEENSSAKVNPPATHAASSSKS